MLSNTFNDITVFDVAYVDVIQLNFDTFLHIINFKLKKYN